MAKSSRILGLLPSIMATQPTSMLANVVAALAQPLEEADTLLFRIQRAHRIKVATQAEDVVLLANALNLQQQHFDDLLNAAGVTYDRTLAAMKRRIERVARLHLIGLGTPWAVVEAAAIMLDADLATRHPGESRLRRLDAAGYSYVAELDFGEDRLSRRGRIYLHENPLRPRSVAAADRYPLDAWLVAAGNVESAPSRIVIQGLGDRAVLPTVFCPATGEGITFYGVVPDGARLTIDAEDGARLDGRPVDGWVSYERGARSDFSRYGADTYVLEEDGPRPPFDGDLSRLFTPPYRQVKQVPQIPPGTTEWCFGVAQGIWDHSDADYAVYYPPDEPRGAYDQDPGFDDSIFDFSPSATVSMTWRERMPCAFKLLVPGQLPGFVSSAPAAGAPAPAEVAAPAPPAAAPAGTPTDLGRIAAFVARCKAAGVRAFVDVARAEWILGESVLRPADASSGPGVDVAAAVVRLEGDDLLVPIDPSSPTLA